LGTSAGNLKIIYDNVSLRPDLRPDWGFSCWVDLPGAPLLFDTGADSRILLENMSRMGLDPLEIAHVVLSHGHGDHTGGLAGLLARSKGPAVYVPASFPSGVEEALEAYGSECQRIHEARLLFPGVYSTGEMGDVIPEQAMVVESPEGLMVVTGCAHPGIVETAERVVEWFKAPIGLLVGGFHLLGLGLSEIRSVAKRLEALGVQRIVPCHCTGKEAQDIIQDHFDDRCYPCGAGLQLSW
jgi:7,8-dihydropterin-6-yl-methyl-4-(beta-D-ribofuranosyl)aminobenzene 5'-phosphate synthase